MVCHSPKAPKFFGVNLRPKLLRRRPGLNRSVLLAAVKGQLIAVGVANACLQLDDYATRLVDGDGEETRTLRNVQGQEYLMRFMIVLRRGLPVALLFCLAVLHFAERTNFAIADLGRHLKNGELFATEGRILAVNGYSYTHPDYPAICHHWLSGYVFYRLWQVGDFFGLSLIYTGLLLATFAIFFIAALRLSSVSWALLGAVLLLPLTACRTAIRPEGLSMLFLAVDFFLL